MRRRLVDFGWLGLVAFAVVTLVAGVALERMVSRQLDAGLANELTTIRDLNVTALREWLDAVTRAAEATAADESVRTKALALIADAEHAGAAELGGLPSQTNLRERLEPTLHSWKLDGYVFVASGRVIGASSPALLGLPIPDSDMPEPVKRGRTAIDLPHKPNVDAFDARDTLMWVVTPITDRTGAVRGALAFRLDTEKTFTRLLRTARFGESGETYALDRDGLFISSSRFEAELRRAGLLAEGERSILNVSAREPGAELDLGARVRLSGPLTRAARAALGRAAGFDLTGYRDYRGVEVVGAWTWLDDYGFAVVTELDRSEAYRSTRVIRRASRVLTALLVVSALVLAGVSAFARRLGPRVRRAERLGQYTLEQKIGEGGMGVVYRARHALLRRPTAIKMLKRDVDEAALDRFAREVQTMASLAHPNTVAVYDYGRTENGVFYYAMEYLDGRSLEELVAETGPLPPARVIHLLLQILGSLAEAHEAGLVHRDVKPANVMLCDRATIADMVKVVDFGLVKVVRGDEAGHSTLHAAVGTPLYMSPEAIEDPDGVDHRSDLYAVGGVAYFLLTGKPVFEATNLMAILSKQVLEEPAPLDGVPAELDALVRQLLAKARDRRPMRAREVIERLETIRRAHGLDWSRDDARAWWTAHPKASPTTRGLPLGSATDVAIRLEGRTG